MPVSADENAQQSKIQSKILLTQQYLESRTAAEIAASESAAAKDLLIRTRELVEQTISDLGEGKLEAAQDSIDRAIKLFTAAAATNTRRKKSHQQYLIEIESVRAEIDAYLESYQAALDAREPGMAGTLDQARVAGLLADAEHSKSNGDIESARAILNDTKELIVAALVDIRNNETLVYKVEFQTPADEFRYEQDRYREYVALGQHVLANGAFDQARVRLFEQLSDTGNQLSREAVAWTEEGDFDSAINRIQLATKKIVQGLQLLGIPLSIQ